MRHLSERVGVKVAWERDWGGDREEGVRDRERKKRWERDFGSGFIMNLCQVLRKQYPTKLPDHRQRVSFNKW